MNTKETLEMPLSSAEQVKNQKRLAPGANWKALLYTNAQICGPMRFDRGAMSNWSQANLDWSGSHNFCTEGGSHIDFEVPYSNQEDLKI